MKISVIIPAYNAETTLFRCLSGLYNSKIKAHEIILVDDCSTDRTVEVANEFNIRIIRKQNRSGANQSRNLGALETTGDILLFLDSDVVIHEDSIGTLLKIFDSPNIDAVVGCYSTTPQTDNLVTNYKNLWIRFSYLQNKRNIDWIFGAVSAIRKEAFIIHNGFDDDLHAKHGVDDLELGKRMHAEKHSIILSDEIVVDHLKQYSLISLLKNEYRRSKWFVILAKNLNQVTHSVKNGFVNIYPNFVWATIISWPLLISFVSAFYVSQTNWIFFLLLVFYTFLNIKFILYYTKVHGFMKGILILPILFLDHLTCSVGSVMGLLTKPKKDS